LETFPSAAAGVPDRVALTDVGPAANDTKPTCKHAGEPVGFDSLYIGATMRETYQLSRHQRGDVFHFVNGVGKHRLSPDVSQCIGRQQRRDG